jgi:hypothetical protein
LFAFGFRPSLAPLEPVEDGHHDEEGDGDQELEEIIFRVSWHSLNCFCDGCVVLLARLPD